jgi:hypothetical protein
LGFLEENERRTGDINSSAGDRVWNVMILRVQYKAWNFLTN